MSLIENVNFNRVITKLKTFGPYTRNGVIRYRNYGRKIKIKGALDPIRAFYLNYYSNK